MKGLFTAIILSVFLAIQLNAQHIKTNYQAIDDELVKVTQTDNDGNKLMEGFLLNGVKHGNWTIYNADGSIAMKAHYEEGLRVGKWIQIDPATKEKEVLTFNQ